MPSSPCLSRWRRTWERPVCVVPVPSRRRPQLIRSLAQHLATRRQAPARRRPGDRWPTTTERRRLGCPSIGAVGIDCESATESRCRPVRCCSSTTPTAPAGRPPSPARCSPSTVPPRSSRWSSTDCPDASVVSSRRWISGWRRRTIETRLYDICVRTGNNGDDARPLYRNHQLLGEIWAGPYLELQPDLAFVAEDDAGVVRLRARCRGHQGLRGGVRTGVVAGAARPLSRPIGRRRARPPTRR